MKTTLPDNDRDAERLLDIEQVSQIVHCSRRHVCRMSAAGAMPAPIRLGTLVRWPRHVIDEWIAAGCPAVNSRETAPRTRGAGLG